MYLAIFQLFDHISFSMIFFHCQFLLPLLLLLPLPFNNTYMYVQMSRSMNLECEITFPFIFSNCFLLITFTAADDILINYN